MARANRIPKTLERKLRDLEDHLYLLKDNLARLLGGDTAYLKPLVAELRVLVCEASRTEGLLWRLVDELQVSDEVHIHFAGNLNQDHRLAKGIEFFHVHIHRAGLGDPRLIPVNYSLRKIIKGSEAVFVLGKSYTHEKLIRALAEQMGAAHEDDGVELQLVKLSDSFLSNQSFLNLVLESDADFIFEVGERVLSSAVENFDFVREVRQEITLFNVPVDPFKSAIGSDFEIEDVPIASEGTRIHLINNPDAEWVTNDRQYKFGLSKLGGVPVGIIKHSNRTLEIGVYDLGGLDIVVSAPIPYSKSPGVMMIFTWNKHEIIFYLNGVKVAAVRREEK